MGHPYGSQGEPPLRGYQPQQPPNTPMHHQPGGLPPRSGRPAGDYGRPSATTAVVGAIFATLFAAMSGYAAKLAFDAAGDFSHGVSSSLPDLSAVGSGAVGSSADGLGADESIAVMQIFGLWNVVGAVVALVGGILLITRRRAGVHLLVPLAGAACVANVIALLVSLNHHVPSPSFGGWPVLGPAIALLGCALSADTRRWLDAAPGKGAGTTSHR